MKDKMKLYKTSKNMTKDEFSQWGIKNFILNETHCKRAIKFLKWNDDGTFIAEDKYENIYTNMMQDDYWIVMDIDVIPKGEYCYGYLGPINLDNNSIKINDLCPYWSSYTIKCGESDAEVSIGSCKFLGLNDEMEDGTMLLFDQCKECGVNDDR